MQQQTVRTLMTNQVLTVPAEATPAEVVAIITAHDVSALAVVDEFDVVIGVLTRTDVLNALTPYGERPRSRLPWRRRERPGLGWSRATAREMMTASPVSIGPEATPAEAARLMDTAGVKRLLVTDRRRRLLGIIAAADLLRGLGRSGETAAPRATVPAGADTPARRAHPLDGWWQARRPSRSATRVPSAVG
ncbi:CBS domain-containing protein [Actinoplanes sp. NPDC049316]|uniref:CBS domain-containing protein n=1 Tax=Actinoplanes sp. NPDC049316 TaxID=3154727 RepID=UPI003419610F